MVVELHRRTDEGRDEIVKKKIFRVKNPVTIAKDAREYTWKDMPRLDDEGHLYVYYVKVLKIGNDVVRDGLAGDIVVKEKGLNIMNSIKEKNMTVAIDWENLGFAYMKLPYRYIAHYKNGQWGSKEN